MASLKVSIGCLAKEPTVRVRTKGYKIMFPQTRFSSLTTKTVQSWRKKAFVFKTTFPVALFTLLFGFNTGNLFGTFLTALRLALNWDGLIILLVLLVLECVSSLIYSQPFKGRKGKQIDPACLRGNCQPVLLSSVETQALYSSNKQENKCRGCTGSFALDGQVDDQQCKQKRKAVIRYCVANKGGGACDKLSPPFLVLPATSLYKGLNYFKIGLMLGFFVDAFKVGS